jgi:hypothetical protein
MTPPPGERARRPRAVWIRAAATRSINNRAGHPAPMPQYAVIGGHEANGCPMASKGAREVAVKAYQQLDTLLKQKHVKLVQDLHLDPGHKAFMLFEAPSAEAVRDVLLYSGLASFLNLEFHLVTPIAELLPKAGEFPTYYP